MTNTVAAACPAVLLSLIVPVYRVEKYLAVCLDSIFSQSFADLEVIAVDDGSDDGSAQILSTYASRHSRLKVVTLPQNGGLSAARNLGLAHATGQYVWFVDSDDWLPNGTLTAVAERLAQTRPDLLIVGYGRAYPDGRVTHHGVGEPNDSRPVAEVVTVEEQPSLLKVLWIACNRVIRREFLIESGLVFAPGWYEDVSFAFPLMLAAKRIALLDRYCYAYRQRSDGAITQTVSRRHFEMFDQWQRVFDRLDSTRSTAVRQMIFQRMIWHFLKVLAHPRRIPPALRREYFAQATTYHRRHLPAEGCPPLPGNDGIKQRLLTAGAYRLFEMLTTLSRARRRLNRALHPPRQEPVDLPFPTPSGLAR
ncbi:glycosyltransferase family 2 protein [Micromonospora sp. NPDC003197]